MIYISFKLSIRSCTTKVYICICLNVCCTCRFSIKYCLNQPTPHCWKLHDAAQLLCQYALHTYWYVRWPKWLTFHFHTVSQFRILISEFRIQKFILRISECWIRNSEFRFLKSVLRISEFRIQNCEMHVVSKWKVGHLCHRRYESSIVTFLSRCMFLQNL